MKPAEESAAGEGPAAAFRGGALSHLPGERRLPEGLGAEPRLSYGHSQFGRILLADVLLQDAGVYVGGLQGAVDVVACRRGTDVSWGGVWLLGLWAL